MKNVKKTSWVMVVVFLIFTSLCNAATYEIIDLGTLGGGNRSEARSINDNNKIIGTAWTSSDNRRACSFNPTGNNADLGTLGGDESQAFSVNINGQVVGGAFDSLGKWHACLFAGQNIDLGTLNTGNSEAQSINDNGEIVGRADGWTTCLFDPADPTNNISLGSLSRNAGVACSINNEGLIVGWGGVGLSSQHACLFDPTGNGNNVDLDPLSGESMPSGAWSINESSKIVGYYTDFSDYIGFSHACIFDVTGNGNNIDLGTLDGNPSNGSVAYSINDRGQIVGTARTSSGEWHACLFNLEGSPVDLNTLIDPSSGWTLNCANCINNNGWIVGEGINPDGYGRAFLLTPEPSILLLIGFGAVIVRKK